MTDSKALEELRATTVSYQTDRAFLAAWGGLSVLDVTMRTIQQRAFVELLSTVWPSLSGRSILDVGCGSGRWLRWYLELGAAPTAVVGVDVSGSGR